MPTHRVAVLALAVILGALAGQAEPTPAPQAVDTGVEQGPAQEPTVADDDSTIYPSEVIYPASDSQDGWGGRGPPPWYEDPASVDCDEVPSWCQAIEASAVEAA